MDLILDGEATAPLIAAMLVALRMKGETPEELLGFARSMRARAVAVRPELNGEALIDTCGTGGDGSCTFNVSTVSALVIAGAGVKVAKHGNRSISSQCGSADVFEALGGTRIIHGGKVPDRERGSSGARQRSSRNATKSMKPRSGWVSTSRTRMRSPTSSPSVPSTTMPSAGGRISRA